jgi:8-oxo-dGTP pyrophosphatase MutT (NUDIX family)
MIEKKINDLKIRLQHSLPGESAHKKMAPSNRPLKRDTNCQLAGVMLLLYQVNEDLFTAFMKRTEYPGVHSGQISLPGGRYEATDENLLKTALRETEEEFGIPQKNIEIIGNLTPLHIPVSGFDVYPFIGYLKAKPLFKTDPEEVAYLIEVSADFLCKPEIKKVENRIQNNKKICIPYFEINKNKIWGATAMILNEFIEIWGTIK